MSEFSFRTREAALRRFKEERFDLLIVGGGITGAATARDAVSRGLKVALVEKNDFAHGTSSRSSKLIHGGLRYLQNMEFGLVFEALTERSLLLRTAPTLVRPLPFYFPVYEGDPVGRGLLGMGMWLYDLLALFRAPGFHRSLSKTKFLAEIPFLRAEGLKGGFRYYDASMWDDVLAVETLRSAQAGGAAVANYCEARSPIWNGERIEGFRVRDLESAGELDLRASRVVVCAGPWTDQVGRTLSREWDHWLKPSKGVHLLFDLKRIPIPGAMVMSEKEDGRIAFVIPRPDFGAGVVIVGTTDGPTPADPDGASVEASDVRYLLSLLHRYFPDLKLTASDILSAYVGVRPLMDPALGGASVTAGSEGQSKPASGASLQKVSREHHIGSGPGGTVLVAGGKYTTARAMAEEIVDVTLEHWRKDQKAGRADPVPASLRKPRTREPINPAATPGALAAARAHAASQGRSVPEELYQRYGAEADAVLAIHEELTRAGVRAPSDPEGFPLLGAQLVFALRTGMAVHLADFYLRRLPLYASRADHGMPWAEALSRIWARERGLGEAAAGRELEALRGELEARSAWVKSLGASAAKQLPP